MQQKAFTLIELLVVVLIIGILAAVAIPQYQVTVGKSRYAELITIGNALARAEETFYLANNTYTRDLSNLDVDFSQTYVNISWLNDTMIQLAHGTDTYPAYVIYLAHHSATAWANKRECRARASSNVEMQICRAVTGKSNLAQLSEAVRYATF